ncbi:hypothetical protein MTO96_045742, partial [Rhipicephalus appendiculatus]
LGSSIKNKSLPDGLVSTLSLPGAQREHSGVYVCKVANDYGQDEKHIRLIVQGGPVGRPLLSHFDHEPTCLMGSAA